MNKRSPITTHVLDTSLGKPAGAVPVILELQSESQWKEIGKSITNEDGRADTLLFPEHGLKPGSYRLTFDTRSYFQSHQRKTFYPVVTVSFEVVDPAQHYHVPLLLSPYGYSTYRGS